MSRLARSVVALGCALGAALAGAAVPAAASDDSFFSLQWNLAQIRAADAWAGSTGAGVTIGIVDTGVDADHPDLRGKIDATANCVGGTCREGNAYDVHGHGTMVAGIIVANGVVKGGATGVTLSVYKAIAGAGEREGTGRDQDVAAAIRQAVADGAQVICLSLGSGRGLLLGPDTAQAAEEAVQRGIYVVAAAGNEGQESGTRDVTAPADVAGVIAVAAVDADRRVAAFSNPGAKNGPLGPTSVTLVPRSDPSKKPEVAAPGVRILSTHLDGKYYYADGTSLAAPFVSAGIALLLEAKPGWAPGKGHSVSDFKFALLKGAEKLPGQQTPHDPKAGYGLFRADRTLGHLN